MESVSSHTAHSTSAPLRKYDVFLSFRGEDTRKGFTDHLYAALNDKGIFVFRDDEELEKGEYISEKLLEAIQESEYAIVIISQNYASSKWCLIELTKIVECKRKKQLTILPVFYHVDPSDVRRQKGSFANAFAKHREASMEDKWSWADALKEVGNITGWHVHDRYEATIVKEICGIIFGGLDRRISNNFKDIVGIESQVKEMMTLLCIRSNDIRFIGIYGMGGIGKTTLANIVFERVHSEFETSCFVDDVREEAKKLGIVNLQRQLISKILKDRDIEIWNQNDGIKVIANRFQNKRVFVVLDNINEEMQIEALAKSGAWFGKGSRILLTSRDNHLLKRFVHETYEVKGLSENDALRLFCLKAFKKHHPTNDYENLSKQIVYYAQGLPLALKVFGSLLFDKGLNVWESTLKRLKEEFDVEILDKLKISFDDLSNSQKELFLDIACFFNTQRVDNVIRKLKSLDNYVDSNFEVLQDRSLIKVLDGVFYMHDLLREMGHQIVRQQSLKDPDGRSRLWCNEDIIYILQNDTGTDAVEAILLKLPLPKPVKLSFEGFSKMKKLRMLVIRLNTFNQYEASVDETFKDLSTVEWYGDPLKFMLSNDLRVIEWWGYSLKYLPTNFEPNNLVEFKIPMSSIKQLWDATKNFEKLKYIDLSESRNLTEMPDFSGVLNLEELNVKGTTIKQLSLPIVHSKKLNVLCIGGSVSRPITFLLPNLSLCLKFLKELDLSYSNLRALPTDLSCLSLLEILNLSGNKFTRIDGVSHLLNLGQLELKNCTRLKALPPKLSSSLEHVSLDNCQSLTTFSDPRDKWTSTEMLLAGGLSLKAHYFGYDNKCNRISYLAPSSLKFDNHLSRIRSEVAWGPTLKSDIPEWFNRRSTSLPDISGMFQCRLDFNVDILGTIPFLYDHVDDDDVDDRLGRSRCAGYALFIVYEVSELNNYERKRKTQKVDEDGNSSSTISPMFVCELQINNECDPKSPMRECVISPKVPIVFYVPETPSIGRNGVWVFINNSCFQNVFCSIRYLIDSCSITISSLNVEVKECGLRIVFEPDCLECYEIIRSISPHGLDLETLENMFNTSTKLTVSGLI